MRHKEVKMQGNTSTMRNLTNLAVACWEDALTSKQAFDRIRGEKHFINLTDSIVNEVVREVYEDERPGFYTDHSYLAYI